MTHRFPTIVYKLGGSLLTLPGLADRLERALAKSAPGDPRQDARAIHRLLVVGGGELADVVRRWDALHRLGDNRAHDLALRAMTCNARLVASILPKARLALSRDEARAIWSAGGTAVLAAAEFLESEEKASGPTLPRSWDVTSDSVAAYVAAVWPADALVLIKSGARPAGDAASAARSRAVDAYFPRAASGVRSIGWLNLRAEPAVVEAWLETEAVIRPCRGEPRERP